jgi:hypothetical protein
MNVHARKAARLYTLRSVIQDYQEWMYTYDPVDHANERVYAALRQALKDVEALTEEKKNAPPRDKHSYRGKKGRYTKVPLQYISLL